MDVGTEFTEAVEQIIVVLLCLRDLLVYLPGYTTDMLPEGGKITSTKAVFDEMPTKELRK